MKAAPILSVPFDFEFALEDGDPSPMWQWAKPQSKTVPLRLRGLRRGAQKVRCRELKKLGRENLAGPFLAPPAGSARPLEFEVAGRDQGAVNQPLPARPSASEPLLSLLVVSLRLAKWLIPHPTSLLKPVEALRKWRIVLVRSKAKPAKNSPPRPAAARLLLALLHAALGFFGSTKVDARNNP